MLILDNTPQCIHITIVLMFKSSSFLKQLQLQSPGDADVPTVYSR